MARCLQDIMRRQHRAVDLEHILLEHEVLPPYIHDRSLERATGWTVIVKTRDS